MQEKYDLWNRKVKEIAKENFRTTRRKKDKVNKTIRRLRRKKRLLKMDSGLEGNKINIARRKLIQQLIEEEQIKQEKDRLINIAKNIKKEKGFDANAFWELNKRVSGRKTITATAMKDEDGNIEEDPEKIKEIYRKYYQTLLKDREPDNDAVSYTHLTLPTKA